MLINNSDKHTLSGGSNRSSVDRISCLPDAVLSHVLSFLPTENAVRASILSTRWKYIWVSIPNLDFWDRVRVPLCPENYANKSKIDSFNKFVDRILVFHDPYTIQKFRLQCVDTYGYAIKSDFVTDDQDQLGTFPNLGFNEDGWLHDTLLLSFLSKLKFVKIGAFVGTKYQKCLVAYLLEKTLEKMTLCLDDSKKENEILEWILNLPRGSPGI